MTLPRSKVLRALEREMLRELDPPRHDGWVVVRPDPDDQPFPLPWTFGVRKRSVHDALLSFARVSFPQSFPLAASREAQLRWLRRRGFAVRKAALLLAE